MKNYSMGSYLEGMSREGLVREADPGGNHAPASVVSLAVSSFRPSFERLNHDEDETLGPGH